MTNQLILSREITGFFFLRIIENINMSCGQTAQFFNVKGCVTYTYQCALKGLLSNHLLTSQEPQLYFLHNERRSASQTGKMMLKKTPYFLSKSVVCINVGSSTASLSIWHTNYSVESTRDRHYTLRN
jgi:hypothetical protein